MSTSKNMLKLLEHLQRTGFIFPSAQIHGGLKASYDYGFLGTELKRNIQNAWWRDMVYRCPETIVSIDTAILTPKSVFAASGHLSNFSDDLVDCKLSQQRFRPDKAGPIKKQKIQSHAYIPLIAKNSQEAIAWQTCLSEKLLPGISTLRRDKNLLLFYESFSEPSENNGLITPGNIRFIHCPETISSLWSSQGAEKSFADPTITYFDISYHGYVNSNNSPFLTEPRSFNLMFKTFLDPIDPITKLVEDTLTSALNLSKTKGSVTCNKLKELSKEKKDQVHLEVSEAIDSSVVYLRPETAQGVFVNYLNSLKSAGGQLPFGVAQVGKAFRNEVTVEHAIFRTPEFEQMELEFFTLPETSKSWHKHWVDLRFSWWHKYCNEPVDFRAVECSGKDLAHYSSACTDIEYQFPWGWGEVEGIANRGDFDLISHFKATGRKLGYPRSIEDFANGLGDYCTPHVVESSAGLSRACLAFLLDAYNVEPETNRVILKLHPALAPIKVVILPLINNEKLNNIAQQLTRHFQLNALCCRLISQKTKIGKRYFRMDEIGTPYCVTIDFQTIADRTVTLRFRDTSEQIRISIDEVIPHIQKLLDNCSPLDPILIPQEN